jgi:HEAT repeat protein
MMAAYAAADLAKSVLDSQQTIPILIEGTTDPQPDIRMASARSLGLIGTEAMVALPALNILLSDREGSVRSTAAEAIARICHLPSP